MISLSSSDIVQLTLWVLIAFSLITWALIIYKTWIIFAINKGGQSYSQQFWAANDLETAAKLDQEATAMGRIAGAGFKALHNLSNNTSPMLQLSGDIESILERSLRQQISKERKTLEQGLSMLASIGSTAPFVGLFGTVWGIMHALQSISHAKISQSGRGRRADRRSFNRHRHRYCRRHSSRAGLQLFSEKNQAG